MLALMAQGLTNAGLCSELHLDTRIVEGHVRSIFTNSTSTPTSARARRVLGSAEVPRA